MSMQSNEVPAPRRKSGMHIYRQPIEDVPRERLEQHFLQLCADYADLEMQLANRKAAVARVIAWADGEHSGVLDVLMDRH